MWTAIARGGIGLVMLLFLMWVLRTTLDIIIPMGTAGAYGDAASVARVSGYFGAMTIENLTLIAALAVGVFLLGRAAVERRVG
jgi:hypothetical protein